MIYFAKFHLNENNQYEVEFPDLYPYASTFGDTLEEAIQSAWDCLAGYLLTTKEVGEKVSAPSPETYLAVSSPDFLEPILVDFE